MDIGTTVSPTNYQDPSQGQRPQGGPINPVQDAIRILSFRVPSVVGANSPIPQSLMGGPTALGPQLSNNLMINWLRMLMGQGGPDIANGGGPMMPPRPGGFRLPNEGRMGQPGTGGPSVGAPPVSPPVNVTPGGQDSGKQDAGWDPGLQQAPAQPSLGGGPIGRGPFSRGA